MQCWTCCFLCSKVVFICFCFCFLQVQLVAFRFFTFLCKKKQIGLGVLLHSAHLWVSLELWSSHKLRISHIKQYDVSRWKTVSALMLSLFQTRLINKLINKQTGQEGGGAKLGSGVFPQISGFISGHATFVVLKITKGFVHPSIHMMFLCKWVNISLNLHKLAIFLFFLFLCIVSVTEIITVRMLFKSLTEITHTLMHSLQLLSSKRAEKIRGD